jgi:hypothetical protein
MPGFAQSPTLSQSSFIPESKVSSQSAGPDGYELKRKINDFSSEIEPIQRLLKSYEAPNEQRHLHLRDYLDSLQAEALSNSEAEFTIKVLDIAWQVWNKLKDHFQEKGKCLEVPDACPGSQDNFMYTWSKADHHFECEIFGSGEVEFFYRNRSTDEVWGEDITLEQGFSTTILEKTAIFAW